MKRISGDRMVYDLHCYFACKNRTPKRIRICSGVDVLFDNCGKTDPQKCFSAKEGVIFAVKIESDEATKALDTVDLLCAAYTVVTGHNRYSTEDLLNEVLPEEEKKEAPEFHSDGVFERGLNWYFAAKLVSNAYGEQRYKNAVCRYHTAHEIMDLHPLDFHPYWDAGQEQPFLSKSIRVSNIIIVCHSVLEEIGIQFQLNHGEQLLDETMSAWSQNAIKECKKKLRKIGIDSSSRVYWISRNKMSISDENHAIDRSVPAEDNHNSGIQDYMIGLVDGVLEIKWLRNKLGAHKLGEKVLSLSSYDAENAFTLTRFVLLKVLQIDLNEELPIIE